MPPFHLQSVVTALGDDAIVGNERVTEHAAFSAVPQGLAVDPQEPDACNVLAIGRSVIVPWGNELTPAAITALGYEGEGARPLGVPQGRRRRDLSCAARLSRLPGARFRAENDPL